MSWPAVLCWFAMVICFLLPGPALLYLLQILIAFSTLQMIPASELNFLPGSLCAGFLILKVFAHRGNLVRGMAMAANPAQMGLFAAFVLYAALTALLLPRIFAGQITVVPVSKVGTDLLRPTAGNVTQVFYALLSFATSLAFAVAGTNRNFQRHFRYSVAVGGLTILVTGIVDLVLFRTGHSDLLAPFRTASYHLLADGEVEGAKRIVGLTPEASAYGALCMGCLATLIFLRPMYSRLMRRVLLPILIIALFAMTYLSTSSTAYLGLMTLAAVYGGNLILRAHSRLPPVREGLVYEAGALPVVLFVAAALFIFSPDVSQPVYDLFDHVVLRKASSASFAERGMWTRVGFEAFLDSGLMGVGLGSLRTSNWFVSILASTGLLGGLLIFGFLVRILCFPFKAQSLRAREMVKGCRLALLPTMVMSAFAGTIPDIGVHNASLYGFIIALGCGPLLSDERLPQQELRAGGGPVGYLPATASRS